VQRSKDYPNCDVTVIDIIAAGRGRRRDAHELSRISRRHVRLRAIDAVFEHLAMPWKLR